MIRDFFRDFWTDFYLYPGESCTVVCDGSRFETVGRSTGLVLISTQAGSGVASMGFITGITADFNEYEFHLSEIASSYASVDAIQMRLAQGAGFQTGAGAYSWGYSYLNTSALSFEAGSLSDTSMKLHGGITNGAGQSTGGIVRLFNPAGAMYKRVNSDLVNFNTGANVKYIGHGSLRTSTDPVWGAQFFLLNGNMTGAISMYGVRK